MKKFISSIKNIRYATGIESDPSVSEILAKFEVNYGRGKLTIQDIDGILTAAAEPPHGRELFAAALPPEVPEVPAPPYSISRPAEQAVRTGLRAKFPWFDTSKEIPGREGAKLDEVRQAFGLYDECTQLRANLICSLEKSRVDSQRQLDQQLEKLIEDNDCTAALSIAMQLADHVHALPKILRRNIITKYDRKIRALLLELEVPPLLEIKILKKGSGFKYIELAKREYKASIEKILYSLMIRAAYLGAKSDIIDCVDIVVVNAKSSWRDKNTGNVNNGTIASLQVEKTKIININISYIDPKSCFVSLKGLRTPDISNASTIRPIFEFSADDDRIMEPKTISDLSQYENLASMEWEDFEHLVRQLFEWEFGVNGAEVKITRASRDRGVDAIMFDPDPIRGGKYVIQAKRYNVTVGVDAVRDLYGTVINEGANRGILVTTSSYGPDSYEFAKGKPISLIDGNHLLRMFEKHGKNFQINLKCKVD